MMVIVVQAFSLESGQTFRLSAHRVIRVDKSNLSRKLLEVLLKNSRQRLSHVISRKLLLPSLRSVRMRIQVLDWRCARALFVTRSIVEMTQRDIVVRSWNHAHHHNFDTTFSKNVDGIL